MKKRNVAILLKSFYVLLVTFIALAGLTMAAYSGFTGVWDTGSEPRPGGTLVPAHINELKTAIDEIYSKVTIEAGGITIDGEVCDSSGNCLTDTPTLDCVQKTHRVDGLPFPHPNTEVTCDAGYIVTGCSINFNDGDGGTWGINVRALPGMNGCTCSNGFKGMEECIAICCRLV